MCLQQISWQKFRSYLKTSSHSLFFFLTFQPSHSTVYSLYARKDNYFKAVKRLSTDFPHRLMIFYLIIVSWFKQKKKKRPIFSNIYWKSKNDQGWIMPKYWSGSKTNKYKFSVFPTTIWMINSSPNYKNLEWQGNVSSFTKILGIWAPCSLFSLARSCT